MLQVLRARRRMRQRARISPIRVRLFSVISSRTAPVSCLSCRSSLTISMAPESRRIRSCSSGISSRSRSTPSGACSHIRVASLLRLRTSLCSPLPVWMSTRHYSSRPSGWCVSIPLSLVPLPFRHYFDFFWMLHTLTPCSFCLTLTPIVLDCLRRVRTTDVD